MMRTILVDDEPWAMRRFAEECEQSEIIDVIGRFESSKEALEFAQTHSVDFALLDIEMQEMNGIELGKQLRALFPDIIIIYVTAYGEYAVDSLKMKADYFILKPYSKADIVDALARVKLLSARQNKPVFIRTFGHFEVFVNSTPLVFKSNKAKELMALLVDRRGGVVSTSQAFSVMWDGRPVDDAGYSLCRKTFLRLQRILDDAGIGNLLVTQKDGRCLDVNMFDCDYYRLLDGQRDAREQFIGEYLTDYSWAEDTLAQLLKLAEKGKKKGTAL